MAVSTADLAAPDSPWRVRQNTWLAALEAMHVDYPEIPNDGDTVTSGSAELARFHVSEERAQWSALRGLVAGHGRGSLPAGLYTKLSVDGVLWMSDTPDERRDHHPVIHQAVDRHARTALVSGLGLGMVLHGLARVPSIERIDVVEANADVIDLMTTKTGLVAQLAEHGATLHVWHGDARDPKALFPRDLIWDVAWHDIWDTIGEDNYEDMKGMRRRYGRRVDWQGVWCGDEVRRLVTGR